MDDLGTLAGRVRAAVRRRIGAGRRELRRRTQQLRASLADAVGGQRPEILHRYSAAVDGARPAVRADLSLVRADAAMLDGLRAAQPKDLSARKHAIVRDRVETTDERCYLVTDSDDAVVGYCHMAVRDHVNARINHLVRLAPGEVYLFDDQTFKHRRREGVHAFSIAARLDAAAQEGATRAVTIVSKGNDASIASYARFGFRRDRVLVHLPRLRRTLSVPRPK